MIDATGAANLASFVEDFIQKKGILFITGLRGESIDMLKQTGLYDVIGEKNFFTNTEDAIHHAVSIIDVQKCPYCKKQSAQKCRVYGEIQEKT